MKLSKPLEIDKAEVLRYLSYNSEVVDDVTNALIDECISEVMIDAQFLYVYRIFSIDKRDDSIKLDEVDLVLNGKDIYEHLKDSDKCSVMAVTLGNEIDKKIIFYTKMNLLKSVVYNACSTALIEVFCDSVQEEIRIIAQEKCEDITSRFSPGYGDLPIVIQLSILNILNAQRTIGLTVSDESILMPRKSVTAFIGLTKIAQDKKDCAICNIFNSCPFRRGGNHCGN